MKFQKNNKNKKMFTSFKISNKKGKIVISSFHSKKLVNIMAT